MVSTLTVGTQSSIGQTFQGQNVEIHVGGQMIDPGRVDACCLMERSYG